MKSSDGQNMEIIGSEAHWERKEHGREIILNTWLLNIRKTR